MLELQRGFGSSFCDGINRRSLLQAGAIGTLGLSLPTLLAGQAKGKEGRAETSPVFGRAKRLLMLFMWGGPAHQDLWDVKIHGPVETRGEFQPIATNVPGLQISEHFPLIAQQADKLALIRSVGQEDNNHSTGAHAGLTGRRHALQAESFGAQETDFPHFGSVLSNLRPSRGGLPTFVALPEVIQTTNGAITPGQGGGWLGRKYDPFQISDHPDKLDFSIPALRLPDSVRLDRMQSRRQLLGQIDGISRLADRSAEALTLDAYYQQALDMVLAPQVREAFDLSKVSESDRLRYGWHTFGQSVLMAKRLLETGVQLVTVYWHREDKTIDTTWDTHALNFQELKQRLMPSVDRPIAALLEDLARSGMLEDTLVVWNSEFGRTPKVNGNAGRDHWGACNTVVMAGGGVPGGQVYGASDERAAYPIANKVTQDDIAATVYHLLGFQPETPIFDRTLRPHAIALGEPIYDLLGAKCRPAPLPVPAIAMRPQLGAFSRMLRERGHRHIACEFGNADLEKDWELGGWSEPAGSGSSRHRRVSTAGAKLKFRGFFYQHFAYQYLAFRLTEAQPIDGVSLSVSGTAIPISEELKQLGSQAVWQIRLPAGLAGRVSSFDLSLTAPHWSVSNFAVLGDKILDVHLRRAEVESN